MYMHRDNKKRTKSSKRQKQIESNDNNNNNGFSGRDLRVYERKKNA